MTTWTTPNDIKTQVRRLWDRGELLRYLVTGETIFPIRLAFKRPTSSELAGQFEAARNWISSLVAVPHVRIDWREVNHRILGSQRVPQVIWIDSQDSALALIGMKSERVQFDKLMDLTRSKQPNLLPWLGQKPLLALKLKNDWEMLLAVVDWLRYHPRPGIYLRQVDIPGLHSKFIETHRGVLAELLDMTLPPGAIDTGHTGAGQFAARYGFLDKPVCIRFRILDARHSLLSNSPSPDITLDAESFAKLEMSIHLVFITENEINYLAFPLVPDSIVIFGKGYGWDALSLAKWLSRCSIHYWGDIDTHGFAILDHLRNRFGHVESFLMDREILMAHETLWGEEEGQVAHDLPRLTNEERALFDTLKGNLIRKGLRLEQERVGFKWVEAAVGALSLRPKVTN
ncbi:MAG: hypothetical protein KJ548_14600 [Actinobacteria bacterium]|jgi:hypothetical protein|nr:hypothetical protein [Actinomycetota bacterium]